ncbi:MAG: L-2-amino-thiazoline-4-carboxylic acid hydrolase [Desulfomonilaceae bacterium]|nr:L-2-amino-thiazoline-4-carboxylic acid hydrolase [Desulfomonilaceae bacterium]
MEDGTGTTERSEGSGTAEDVLARIASVDLLTRRGIEAMIVGPLYRAFSDEFGPENALKAIRKVVEDISLEQGANLAEALGNRSLNTFCGAIRAWSSGGALEIEMVEQDDQRLSFNVTRCRYAELYDELGIRELGVILSCSRDFALIRGFNPDMGLTRTQTIMEGADHCDFRITMPV